MELRPTPIPRNLASAPVLSQARWLGPKDVTVTGVTLDSRRVMAGDLYAALPGSHTHGARFWEAAKELGAVAILTDVDGERAITDGGDPGITLVVVTDPRRILGDLAAWIFDHPGADMKLVGITGTNGKTTMSYVVGDILAAAGHEVGIIGTIGIRIGHEEIPSQRTTPESPDVHRLLAVMRERGVTAVAMEVSSHALALGRVDGVLFDVAVFTNLSQDHLDFHGSMDEYFAVKSTLFEPTRSRIGLVCIDDSWGARLASAAHVPVTTYGLESWAQWTLRDVHVGAAGTWSAQAVGPDRHVDLKCSLPGRFNHANVLGGFVAASQLGVPDEAGRQAIEAFAGVPGRMEVIDGPFAAFVDYAHTPDAVVTALAAAREFGTGRILAALGCGGDRDRGKRSQMGRVASMAADVLVITDDNPRSEDPALIRQEMLSGAGSGTAQVIEIGDRGTAIQYLVDQAQADDVVLILGKGHEQGQHIGDQILQFDDRTVLAQAIKAAHTAGEGSK